MAENYKCPCSNSSVSYTVIGEDLWLVTPNNCRVEETKRSYILYCKECNRTIDSVDKYMCKLDSNYKE